MYNLFPHHFIKYIWALKREEILLAVAQWIYRDLLMCWEQTHMHTYAQGHTHLLSHTHTHKKKKKDIDKHVFSRHARTRFLGRGINYYAPCRSLRLIPPVMDVTLCDAAKCVLEMCLELLCGTAECFGNEIITGCEPL